MSRAEREVRALRDRLASGAMTPEVDLAIRLARLQGAAAGVVGPAAPEIPDDVLRSWLADPDAFATWLGVSLFPYQAEALRLIRERDRVCLAWGRQCGKDHLTALYGLYVALTKPRSVVVCVSPSQRQSDLWAERLTSFALCRREIRASIADLSQSDVTFTNGSRVVSLPSGAQGSATIRGFSKVTLLVCNEAAWIGDDTFQAAQPFLAASGSDAKLVLISTPFGQTGMFWRSWNNDLFAKSHARSADSPLISPEFLEKEKASMDSLSFASEYEARFLSGQSSYFPTELIASCVQAYGLVETPLPEHAGMRFFLGCDWGRVAGGDQTVLTVVGIDADGKGRVVWIKAFEGLDYVQQGQYVRWLTDQWRFSRVYTDASNHAENDLLRKLGVPVWPVVFTVPSKVEMFGRLKNAMEAGRLVIPQHADLVRELSTFQYKISDAGNLLLHHVAGGHDDFPDSLALAASAITKARGEPGIAIMPWGPERAFAPAQRPPRLQQPIVGPSCAACGAPIEPGQPFTVSRGMRHATCLAK